MQDHGTGYQILPDMPASKAHEDGWDHLQAWIESLRGAMREVS